MATRSRSTTRRTTSRPKGRASGGRSGGRSTRPAAGDKRTRGAPKPSVVRKRSSAGGTNRKRGRSGAGARRSHGPAQRLERMEAAGGEWIAMRPVPAAGDLSPVAHQTAGEAASEAAAPPVVEAPGAPEAPAMTPADGPGGAATAAGGAESSGSAPAEADPPLMVSPRRRRLALRGLLAAGLLVSLVVAAVTLPVSSQGNSGTIKVHDEADADPDERNEPHVDCEDFWIEGFRMAESHGDLFFYSWPPTGDKELLFSVDWETDGEDPEHHFLAGPFSLDPGHYRVFASNGDADDAMGEEDDDEGADDDDTDGGFGGMKKKTFWVEPCAEEPEPDCGEPGAPPCPEPEEPLACPAGLLGVANDDQSVTLTWTPAEGSDGTNVYRAEGDGDFEYVTTVAADVGTYTDSTTVVGESYAYTVTALFGDEESEDCDIVEVTAIPVFPSALAGGLALLGGVFAFGLARRRQA